MRDRKSGASRITVAAIGLMAALVAGCGRSVDGVYQGHSSFWLMTMNWKMKIDGDKAIIADAQDGHGFAATVKRDGDRVILTDSTGSQLSLHVKDGGKTLECPQCDSVKLPTTWEKEVR